MATWSDISFQDSNSTLMEELMFFHDHSLMILTIITVIVGILMISLIYNTNINRFLLEMNMIEIIWTILPALVLVFVALPSLRLLYLLEELYTPLMTLKTLGHQWYWSYEYSDFNILEFDSYLMSINESMNNIFRLLDVDNRIILPYQSHIRNIVTATDVLHSWTIPSMGVKVDATPGRLNQTSFFMKRLGLYYGQCSEICGANHSFMPIVIESVKSNFFMQWLLNMLKSN
uniref:Cytochrome c oxidase subunit 2 n=1 Tax=Broscus cephalotes TaxID=1553377 RepID=A0A343EYY8_9CARA|nr:cytochrome c oxidase subunit 2 [Broscus cephalotes]